jgi:UDPglucose 6-dehydrogenase
MKIGFIGLGKLGLPVALAIASKGHEVLAWDCDPVVRECVRQRRPRPGEEDQARELLSRSVVNLAPMAEIVRQTELIFVAVQTPHEPRLDGSVPLPDYTRDFDYSHLVSAVATIGDCSRQRHTSVTVAVISTVVPGTMRRVVAPLLPPQATLAYNPSFTAMGSTVSDFLSPELVLLGVDPPYTALQTLRHFYGSLHDRPLFETDMQTAELIKVAYNTFIGQKIVFANAMMELCEKVGADVDDVSTALGMAGNRIISSRYLRGGMGDGGPCHPRDNIALSWLSQQVGLSKDIFGSLLRTRESQTEWLAELIEQRAAGLPVVILGKAFKPESHLTDGSPALLLGALLERRGVEFRQLDHHVDGGPLQIPCDGPALFFIATAHNEYSHASFPSGSLVVDPWGYIPDTKGVTVWRLGRRGGRPDGDVRYAGAEPDAATALR